MNNIKDIKYAESEIFLVCEDLKNAEIGHNPDIEASKASAIGEVIVKEPIIRRDQSATKSVTTSGALMIGQFSLGLFLDDDFLRIEAEHQETGKLYSETFTSDVLKQKTSQWFTTTGEMYDSLKLAIEGCDDNLKVEMSDQAVITLSIKTLFGVKERILVFNIELKELNLNPLQLCAKYFEDLKKGGEDNMTPFNRQLLKVIQKIIEHSDETEKELEQTLQRVKFLEEKLQGQNKQESEL